MLQNRLSFRCVIHVPLSFETETRLRPGLTLSGGEILAAHAAHADVPWSGLGAPVVGVPVVLYPPPISLCFLWVEALEISGIIWRSLGREFQPLHRRAHKEPGT